MSHPENTKAPTMAQPMATTEQAFANRGHGELLSVRAGVPADEALGLARNLAHGLQCLCEHLGDVVNYGGELTYLDEMRALSFLGETVGALIFSVERSVKAQGGDA